MSIPDRVRRSYEMRGAEAAFHNRHRVQTVARAVVHGVVLDEKDFAVALVRCNGIAAFRLRIIQVQPAGKDDLRDPEQGRDVRSRFARGLSPFRPAGALAVLGVLRMRLDYGDKVAESAGRSKRGPPPGVRRGGWQRHAVPGVVSFSEGQEPVICSSLLRDAENEDLGVVAPDAGGWRLQPGQVLTGDHAPVGEQDARPGAL